MTTLRLVPQFDLRKPPEAFRIEQRVMKPTVNDDGEWVEEPMILVRTEHGLSERKVEP